MWGPDQGTFSVVYFSGRQLEIGDLCAINEEAYTYLGKQENWDLFEREGEIYKFTVRAETTIINPFRIRTLSKFREAKG